MANNSKEPPADPARLPVLPPRKALLPPGYKPAVAPGMMLPLPPPPRATQLSPERLQERPPDLPPKRKIPPLPPPRLPRLPLGYSQVNFPEYPQEPLPAIAEVDSQQTDFPPPVAIKKKRKKKMDWANVPVGPDPYFKSDKVMGLNTFNFDSFITQYEKTLIMFFDSINDKDVNPAIEFTNASIASMNRKHAFASVNCSVDRELCCREEVTQTPTFKLLSNGHNVGTISYLKDFNATRMNMFMAMSPVLNQARTEMRK